MLILRIERNGMGPYRDGATADFLSRWGQDHQPSPMADVDGWHWRTSGRDWRFGFADPGQLREWFPDEFLQLCGLGFELVIYRSTDVLRGRSQVAFRDGDVLDRSPLRDAALVS